MPSYARPHVEWMKASTSMAMQEQRRTPHSIAAQDRMAAILETAVTSLGVRGYYGTSLQSIANGVGLTKAGVLHYVGSKEGLLELVLDKMYDLKTDEIFAAMQSEERPLIAELWRKTVAVNAQRPELVRMFTTLSAEALDPAHPAHDYFESREGKTDDAAHTIRWSLPDGVQAGPLLQAGFSMMDGIQLRWLRNPGNDLNTMWSRCESVLMPYPLWQGYR